MVELQGSVEVFGLCEGLIWSCYAIAILLVIQLTFSGFDDDDDQDGGMMPPVYQGVK